MAESFRISSPSSSSPGPSRGSLSRPHFPWTTYTHRSSQSSVQPSGASTSGTVPPQNASWDSLKSSVMSSQANPSSSTSWSTPTSRHITGSSMAYASTALETTRQWSFTAFEWIVRDVNKLRDFVEGQQPVHGEEGHIRTMSGQEDFEILKESPHLGDGKFKLEIARTPRIPEDDASIKPQTLSLYITSLMLDFAQHDFEIGASMMAAIKCQDDRAGERGARAEWIWEFWQNDWTFRQESEVWECPLPLLSALLENNRIQHTDSFVICIQIHCPVGPFFPQQPAAYYVPRDLLDGLEASLDNANTGDVRFVCLEKQSQPMPSHSPSEVTTPISRRSSSSASSHSLFPAQTTARKRIIYAHSDILTQRSDYFSTMLASSFAENTSGLVPGERKLYTVVVEEAAFEEVYWLLKWVYANWLLFKEEDDPRAAVDGVGAGWSARWLNVRGGEWDWKTFRKISGSEDSNYTGTRDDARSATSAESLRSNLSTGSKRKGFQPVTTPTSSTRQSSSSTTTSSTPKTSTRSSSISRQVTSSLPRRSATGPSAGNPSGLDMSVGDSQSTSAPRIIKPDPIPLSVPAPNYSSSSHYPISPRSQRQHPHPPSIISTPDPHPHPTPPPPPASALSMYQVAHRYAMPGLAALALEHMMSTITPQSSFALLLATSAWDELRTLVEDYVVDKWDDVSVSEEFEQCCQEVAAGEWGAQGGKTLMGLFRRLRSPS